MFYQLTVLCFIIFSSLTSYRILFIIFVHTCFSIAR
jgi:hypothetical protein